MTEMFSPTHWTCTFITVSSLRDVSCLPVSVHGGDTTRAGDDRWPPCMWTMTLLWGLSLFMQVPAFWEGDCWGTMLSPHHSFPLRSVISNCSWDNWYTTAFASPQRPQTCPALGPAEQGGGEPSPEAVRIHAGQFCTARGQSQQLSALCLPWMPGGSCLLPSTHLYPAPEYRPKCSTALDRENPWISSYPEFLTENQLPAWRNPVVQFLESSPKVLKHKFSVTLLDVDLWSDSLKYEINGLHFV